MANKHQTDQSCEQPSAGGGNASDATLHARQSIEQVEEGNQLAPKFDSQGLIPCVTTDYDSGELLMHGYMNAEALQQTIRLGQAVYYSRSRKALWHKGATSGLVQHVCEMRIDDDQDCVWLRVQVQGSGASCHVGYRSCFYRRVPVGNQRGQGEALVFTESEKVFDPQQVYGDAPNPTQL
ncbi:MAG: phosphoribosyl-AMP cyclohydrolase [Pirellulaceae bacterium]|nr:phosphoribosyl-AMP cyclohydrolase [Pirellulaceae bacterium]